MKKMRKRLAALLCAATMAVSAIPVAFPMTAKADVLAGFDQKVQEVAREGCVLVKNENNVLPLKAGTGVSIFGRSQRHYDKYRVFAGSGDGVKVDDTYAVSILDALRDKSSGLKVNEDLVNTYKKWVDEESPYMKSNKPGEPNSDDWKFRRLSQPEMPLTEDLVKDAKSKSDVAVVIISRMSGEDCDAKLEKGSYYLQDAEEDMLKMVTAQFDKVVVLLNITNIMDMSWVDKYGIESVMYVWNGGQSGGQAAADIVTGKESPSGKLADTVAKDVKDYPSYNNYGQQSHATYEEDIYVGYRYFETFAPDKVQYEFGYGLSYTDFDITTESVAVDGDHIKVVVTVKNTGKVAGKEVVQVYYGAPQGKLGNPAKELAAFAKTKELEPGASETLSMSFKISEMASYDDGGATGHESAYVLEAGEYNFYVGNSVKKCKKAEFSYKLDELKVVEQLTEVAAPIKDFQRYKPVKNGDTYTLTKEAVPKSKTNVEQKLMDSLPKELKAKGDGKKYNLIDVYNKKLTMEEFVAQMNNDDLSSVIRGSSHGGIDSYMGGSGSPFGGMITKDGDGRITLTKKYGIPVVTCVDGPAGAKISKNATLMPSGNVIGCTWNLPLIEELGKFEGQEMVLNEVDNLLGPGINIHRDVRNGRNAEYYSEDPLLTGMLGSAMTKGIQASGATATAKHFACNSQDLYRRYVDARISERAMREIYLKAFEIFVKEGHGRAIMTAYNPVNGCYTAGNYDLNVNIIRNEWKFDGMIMTDWWADMNKHAWPIDGDMEKSGDWTWVMVRGGGDIYMINDFELYKSNGEPNGWVNEFFKEMEKGSVTKAEMQRSALNVLNFIIESQAFYRKNKDALKEKFPTFGDYAKTFVTTGEDWFKVEQAKAGNPQVTGIAVDGRKVASFNQMVSEYKVYQPADAQTYPEVKATVAEGTTVQVQQATKDNPVAVISATEDGTTKKYQIVFTAEEKLTPVLENAVLAEISDIKVNGKSISGFDADTSAYNIAVDSLEKDPEITCETAEGVTAAVNYNKDTKTAIVMCATKDQAVSYQLNFGIAPKSDEFNDETLNKEIWTIEGENTANWSMKDGHLNITTERGSLFEGENDHKNQFVQSAYGDWEVVAKVDLDKIPAEDYQSIGIVVKQDDDNYIYPKIEYSGGLEITYTQEVKGKKADLGTLSASDLTKFKDSVYFKLTKLGNTYLAAVSPDGKEYIRFATSASAEYASPKFALVAGTGGADVKEAIKAGFDYVQFKTEGLGDTVKIGQDTKVKLAETAPSAISAALRPEVSKEGGYYLTGTGEGEYVEYNVEVEKSGYYDLIARYAAETSDTQQLRMLLLVDDQIVTDQFSGNTGGVEAWVDLPFGNTKLTAGTHKIRFEFINSSINLNWLQFKLTQEIPNAELCELVKFVNGLNLSVFSEADQTKCTAALQAAEEVIATKEDKESIDAAYKALKEVVDAMVVPGTEDLREELRLAVEDAKMILESGNDKYTEAAWKALEDAYKAAANPAMDATADNLMQLMAELEDAIDGLTKDNDPYDPYGPKPVDPTPEEKELAAAKEALTEAVKELKDLFETGKDGYTEESWDAFEEAYKNALNPKEDATAADLKAILEELEAAEKALEKDELQDPHTPEQLKEAQDAVAKAVEDAEKTFDAGQEDYTEESWKRFETAYEAAQDILKKEDPTMEELTKCKEDLETALRELVKESGNQNPPVDNPPTDNPPIDNPPIDDKPNNPNPPVGNTQNPVSYMNQVQMTIDKTQLYAGGDADKTAVVKVVLPNGAISKSIKYSTSNTSVATVDAAGNVTAKKAGNVEVRAEVTLTNGETKTFSVNVSIAKAGIKKVKVKSTAKVGKKVTLKAIAYGSSKEITWKIKKGTKYAKITKKGKLTPKAKGTIKVVAKAGKLSKTFTIRIK